MHHEVIHESRGDLNIFGESDEREARFDSIGLAIAELADRYRDTVRPCG